MPGRIYRSPQGTYRAYVGRRYVGFFTSKQAARQALAKEEADARTYKAGKGNGQDVCLSQSKKRRRGRDAGQGVCLSQSKKRRLGKDDGQGVCLSQSIGQAPGPKYKYVVPRRIGGRTMFDAQVRPSGSRSTSKVYLGRFAKSSQAANAAAAFLHVELRDCKARRMNLREAASSAKRFEILVGAFAKWEPADLASARRFRHGAAFMWSAAPALYIAGLLGKEHAWKCALVECWAHMPPCVLLSLAGIDSHDEDIKRVAAQRMHDIFSLAAMRWAAS